MSLWLRWRGKDGKRRWYAIEGLQGAAALAIAAAAGLLYLVVILVEHFFKTP
jgi:hypothetical protein